MTLADVVSSLPCVLLLTIAVGAFQLKVRLTTRVLSSLLTLNM